MIGSVFKVLAAGLSLWEHKDRYKYINELKTLKESYYEEYNQEISDDAVLDNIEFKLRVLCESFGSEAGVSNSSN